MPSKGKATSWVKVSLTADKSTPSCKNVRTALLEVVDQGIPQCWPKPGIIFRLGAAEQIGPEVRSARVRGPAARTGATKRTR